MVGEGLLRLARHGTMERPRTMTLLAAAPSLAALSKAPIASSNDFQQVFLFFELSRSSARGNICYGSTKRKHSCAAASSGGL